MPEQLKNFFNKIKDWWLKFNKNQRILFITIAALVVVLIIVFAVIFGRTDYIVIRECQSATEATSVRTLLTDNGITCTVDSDYVVRISKDDEVEAKLILGSNNIATDGYTLDDALADSLTTTETDKRRKYIAYLCSQYASDIEAIDGVKKARIEIDYKESGNTIFSSDEEAYITAILTLTKELSDETCEAIGKVLATNTGTSDSNHVFVMSTSGEILYTDGVAGTSGGSTAAQKLQNTYNSNVTQSVKNLLVQTGRFSEVTVSPNLAIINDSVEIVEHEYSAPEGTDEGLKKTEYTIDSEGAIDAASGTAGSESNDQDTSYLIESGDGSTSTYALRQYEYLQDERITTTKAATGVIDYDKSSLAVVAVHYNTITESQAQERGLLDDMTWDEYKLSVADPVPLTIDDDDDIISLISVGTGIDEDNLVLSCYEITLCYEDEESSVNTLFILQVVLAVIIAALLAFMIIRSMRPVAVEETEPELSVEDMLASTKVKTQESVEDIDIQDKSETRKAIEKFVDENPEAVALLLRNWLNEGWS